MLKLFLTPLSTARLLGRWRLQLAALPLLLVWLPVALAATTYTFPGTLPPGCSVGGSGKYTCSPLTLGAGATITIAAPATITVNGNFTTGAGTKINDGGTAANLTLVIVDGITDLGADTILYGNLIGSLKVKTGSKSKVVGNITTIAGVITIGNNNQVIGNIKTDSAAINIGNDTIIGNSSTGCNAIPVNGNITTTIAGVIDVGTGSTVNGRLTTASGAINVGNGSTINGNILSTVAGAITLGNNVTVTCKVATTYHGSDIGAGAITVGENSQVTGGLATNTGAITVGNNANICGNVATDDGAITIGAHATICESVCSGNSGAITIGADATVGGNVVTAVAGAITVGTHATVGGNVETAGAGAITIETKAIVKGGTDADASIAKDATVGNKTSSSGACISSTSLTFPRVKAREWRQIFMR